MEEYTDISTMYKKRGDDLRIMFPLHMLSPTNRVPWRRMSRSQSIYLQVLVQR